MSRITDEFYSILGKSSNTEREQKFIYIKELMDKEKYNEAIQLLLALLDEDPMDIDASILLLICKIDITADTDTYSILYENQSEAFIQYIQQLIFLYEKIVTYDVNGKYKKELKEYLLFVENMKSILEKKLKYVETIKNNKILLFQSVYGPTYPLIRKKDKRRIATKYYIDTLGIKLDFHHIHEIKSDLSYGEQMVCGVSFEELEIFFKNSYKVLDKKYKALFIKRIFILIILIIGILCLFLFK